MLDASGALARKRQHGRPQCIGQKSFDFRGRQSSAALGNEKHAHACIFYMFFSSFVVLVYVVVVLRNHENETIKFLIVLIELLRNRWSDDNLLFMEDDIDLESCYARRPTRKTKYSTLTRKRETSKTFSHNFETAYKRFFFKSSFSCASVIVCSSSKTHLYRRLTAIKREYQTWKSFRRLFPTFSDLPSPIFPWKDGWGYPWYEHHTLEEWTQLLQHWQPISTFAYVRYVAPIWNENFLRRPAVRDLQTPDTANGVWWGYPDVYDEGGSRASRRRLRRSFRSENRAVLREFQRISSLQNTRRKRRLQNAVSQFPLVFEKGMRIDDISSTISKKLKELYPVVAVSELEQDAGLYSLLLGEKVVGNPWEYYRLLPKHFLDLQDCIVFPSNAHFKAWLRKQMVCLRRCCRARWHTRQKNKARGKALM